MQVRSRVFWAGACLLSLSIVSLDARAGHRGKPQPGHEATVITTDVVGQFHGSGYVNGDSVDRTLDFSVVRKNKTAYLEVSIFDTLRKDTSRDSAIVRLSRSEVKGAIKALKRIETLFKRDLLSNFKPTSYVYRSRGDGLELEYGESYPVDRFCMVKVKNKSGQRTVYFEDVKDFRQVQKLMVASEKAL